jgi:hypothetical protein
MTLTDLKIELILFLCVWQLDWINTDFDGIQAEASTFDTEKGLL